MFVFLGILILGLIYVWAKGDLNWIKPNPVIPTTDARVPLSLYEKLNKQQGGYTVKEFSAETTTAIAAQASSAPVATSAPIRKPMFKPAFKKPENES
jgi:NADH-quinone oxidoreductase subunit A